VPLGLAAGQPVTVKVADASRAALATLGQERVSPSWVVGASKAAGHRKRSYHKAVVREVVGAEDGAEDAGAAVWSAVREVQPVTARATTTTTAAAAAVAAVAMIRTGRMVTPPNKQTVPQIGTIEVCALEVGACPHNRLEVKSG
jgi:hypothetical protein